MTDIQVDMFEVQLGAAYLMQFRLANGETVRILADGGVGHGVAVNHAHPSTVAAINAFSSNSVIDLIIGTHYDGDHLKGLVPIIEDTSLTIREAWLPPVTDDSDESNDPPLLENRTAPFLAQRMYDDPDNGQRVLQKYLTYQARICSALYRYEQEWSKQDGQQAIERLMNIPENRAIPEIAPIEGVQFELNELNFFERHLADADQKNDVHDQSHDASVLPYSEPETISDHDRRGIFTKLNTYSEEEFIDSILHDTLFLQKPMISYFLHKLFFNDGRRHPLLQALSFVRKSSAKRAITAIHLNDVVQALRARKIPIRCFVIPDGQPRRFRWQPMGVDRTPFIATDIVDPAIPSLTLLGPSESLARKHRKLLPIGPYRIALAFTLVPVKQITASNQLSYVLRADFKNQGILISGDTGFVDFRPARGALFYQPLIDALAEPLHVVQVAHHGGHNAHFYNALGAAQYHNTQHSSYLLFSHATNDPHRPSKAFEKFFMQRPNQSPLKLLFTAQPDLIKVRNYRTAIYPTVNGQAAAGNIRLIYRCGKWRVDNHAVQV